LLRNEGKIIMTNRTKCVIVTRFSPRPDDVKECRSGIVQAKRCRDYAEKTGLEVSGSFADDYVSGGKASRPGLDAAIEALRPGMVLLVDRHDRLARDINVSLAIKLRVAERGAEIRFADGTPDESTPIGEFQCNILRSLAQFQRSQIREWCRQASAKKRKEKKVFGTVPIGWKRDGEGPELVRNRHERDAIIHACRLAAARHTSKYIASVLTSESGLCRGKPWNARTVRRIVKREAYWACPVHGDLAKEPTHP
jgi:DNA invertase Pin-like site-specific DNA recombinase